MKCCKLIMAVLCLALTLPSYASDGDTTPIEANSQVVKLVVGLMDGDKSILSAEIRTFDGNAVPLFNGEIHNYVARAETKKGGVSRIERGSVNAGISLSMTPILRADGQIEVRFLVRKTDLLSMREFTHDGVFDLEQAVVLRGGVPIDIPFGPDLPAASMFEPGASQYTLTIAAVAAN